MDLMAVRRRLLAGQSGGVTDTCPTIAADGKRLSSYSDTVDDDEWCYTEWITVENDSPNYSTKRFVEAYASGGGVHAVVQVIAHDAGDPYTGYTDYYFGNADFSEKAVPISYTSKVISAARWSIKKENLDECYAYYERTGQIFFAGKHSPYYGYTNINDMPT